MKPPAACATDHSSSPTPSKVRAPIRSTMKPTGIWAIAKLIDHADCSAPIAVALTWKSSRISRLPTASVERSM